MDYLLIRIEKRICWWLPSLSGLQPRPRVLEKILVHHTLKITRPKYVSSIDRTNTPIWKYVSLVLSNHRYELKPFVGTLLATDWPLLAYVYTSSPKGVVGPAGSHLYCWPVRKSG